MKPFLSILIVLLTASWAWGGTYWVHPTDNSASWATCTGASDPGAGKYCSISTAISNVIVGDTVNLKGGTYTNQRIVPTKSGTSWTSRITWQAASGETPILANESSAGAIYLSGIDYNKFDGIHVSSTYMWVAIVNGSDYNEFGNLDLSNPSEGTWSGERKGIKIHGGGDNWFHDGVIHGHGVITASPVCDDQLDLIQIGHQTVTTGTVDNNLFEDMTLYHAAHSLLSFWRSRNNVVRNNTFHNEGWLTEATCAARGGIYAPSQRNGKFGNRHGEFMDYAGGNDMHNLFEGNRTGHAAAPSDGDGANNWVLGSPGNIYRYNTTFYSEAAGLYLKNQAGGGTSNGDHNKIYNATFYYNGKDSDEKANWKAGLLIYYAAPLGSGSSCENNSIKNNLFYNNQYDRYCNGGSPSYCGGNEDGTGSPTWVTAQTWANNFWTSDGDPLFTNADISDPTQSVTLPDLTLKAGSPAIDGGGSLTTVVSVTDSDTIVLADAGYFQDGTLGPRGANFPGSILADEICIGTVTNCVQISSIDYSTNTVDTVTAHGGAASDNVWLYKLSDGTRILYGDAPDYGANEYVPPKHMQPLMFQ